MKISTLTAVVFGCALLAGCSGVRSSISNSGYHGDEGGWYAGPRGNGSDPDFVYQGELSEFDVLGITRGQDASEQDIQQALDRAKAVKLSGNSSILLIQSGAMFPDAAMVSDLGKYFHVSPFSGVPSESRRRPGISSESRDPESFSKSLRLAAARGGNDVILCYWGALETETENLATKSVTWVPTVSWVVPDEKQHKRIRLKLALVDVRSGDWSVFRAEEFDDSRVSTALRRGARDQQQVELLKTKAYDASVKELVARYSMLAVAGH